MNLALATELPQQGLQKKDLMSDHPTWCAGCGDFSVLALYYKLIEESGLNHTEFASVSGIGCSSRFPYFVNAHGVHFLHGRALPFATGLSLTRPDLHVFVFSGDGDAYSIGGNHLDHVARKNVNITLVVMNNFVYGLTKNQTSPTSPVGYQSKTDPAGSHDRPINPMKKLIAAGATFAARAISSHPKHLLAIMRAAMQHEGFSAIDVLSECTFFYPGAFDGANPRKGGEFKVVPENHDVTDEYAAYKLADEYFPGYFGIFYQNPQTTKNTHEKTLIAQAQKIVAGLSDKEKLEKIFHRYI